MRCGTKIHKGKEIPHAAQVTTHQGRECYLSGIEGNENIVRYLDTGEIKRFKIKTK